MKKKNPIQELHVLLSCFGFLCFLIGLVTSNSEIGIQKYYQIDKQQIQNEWEHEALRYGMQRANMNYDLKKLKLDTKRNSKSWGRIPLALTMFGFLTLTIGVSLIISQQSERKPAK